jgi:hypothetical protein
MMDIPGILTRGQTRTDGRWLKTEFIWIYFIILFYLFELFMLDCFD